MALDDEAPTGRRPADREPDTEPGGSKTHSARERAPGAAGTGGAAGGGLTFSAFAAANSARSHRWHRGAAWTPADWMTALVGEVGEAANILKKLKRSADGITGNNATDTELRDALAEELADVLIHLFLLADAVGVDLQAETVTKFDRVSQRHGFPERLSDA